MEKTAYKDIVGIDVFWKYFPDKPWHYFQDILEFRWYKEFDYEEWQNRFYLELKMADFNNQDVVLLKLIDVSGEGTCRFSGCISGLDIVNLRQGASWLEQHYELVDFEDSAIRFYCNEIEIKVIAVNGIRI